MIHNTVSVVIPTYNRCDSTVRAVKSILNQSQKPVEVIVVDDGSTDGTGAALRQIDDVIHYIWQDNEGPGSARNRGIADAKGEWIAFLDSDDIWQENKIMVQLRCMQKLGVDVAFHDVSFGGSPNNPVIASWNREQAPVLFKEPKIHTELLNQFYSMLIIGGHFFLTSTMMIKRQSLIEIGGFDASLRTNQDIDLYLRLAPRYKVAYVDEPLAHYSPGENRAAEVAARSPFDSHTGAARLRVYEDRVRALFKSYRERMDANDSDRALQAKSGIHQQFRALGGFCWRRSMYVTALYSYLRAVFPLMSFRRSKQLQNDQVLKNNESSKSVRS